MAQKKNNKRIRQFAGLLGLLVAFVGLVAIALLQSEQGRLLRQDIPTAPTAIAAITATAQSANGLNAPENQLFTGWSWQDVLAVRIEDTVADITRTLRQNDDASWTLLDDGSQFEQQTARLIAQTVAIMPYTATLPDVAPEQFSEYGLTSETLYMLVTVLLENGDEHALAIGDLTRDRAGHYTLIDDDETIYITDARPVAYLAQQWRDRLLFAASPSTPQTP
jgi:hypothetical protein